MSRESPASSFFWWRIFVLINVRFTSYLVVGGWTGVSSAGSCHSVGDLWEGVQAGACQYADAGRAHIARKWTDMRPPVHGRCEASLQPDSDERQPSSRHLSGFRHEGEC